MKDSILKELKNRETKIRLIDMNQKFSVKHFCKKAVAQFIAGGEADAFSQIFREAPFPRRSSVTLSSFRGRRCRSTVSPFTKGDIPLLPLFSKEPSSSSPFSKGGLRGIISKGGDSSLTSLLFMLTICKKAACPILLLVTALNLSVGASQFPESPADINFALSSAPVIITDVLNLKESFSMAPWKKFQGVFESMEIVAALDGNYQSSKNSSSTKSQHKLRRASDLVEESLNSDGWSVFNHLKLQGQSFTQTVTWKNYSSQTQKVRLILRHKTQFSRILWDGQTYDIVELKEPLRVKAHKAETL